MESQAGGLSSGQVSLLRKLAHAAMAVVPAAGWGVSSDLAVGLSVAFFAASLCLEAARRYWPWINRLLRRFLPTVFRRWEDERVLGSTWFAVAMLGSFLLYGRDAGGAAVLFLAWGDPLAEVVGRRWGRPGRRKTLVGSLGCLAGCLVAAAVGVGWGRLSLWAALAGAAVAVLAERWSPPPDDNVWMPLLSGLVMVGVGRLLGG